MATHDRKSCSAFINLVAPPIPNSLAVRITNDDVEIIQRLRQSHFYMICGRSKAKFVRGASVDSELNISVEIVLDSGGCSKGVIHISRMRFLNHAPDKFLLRMKAGEDFITLLCGDEIVMNLTPDELLMRRGRHEDFVSGFDNYRELMNFDMLYVGIAKENQDSYSRLIAKGHKARMDILAGEEQRSSGARVSDETFLLLFQIEPITLTTFSGSDDFDDEDLNFSVDYHRIIADAEKAVINTFKPKYNKQLYPSYPKGKDGLYQQGYSGYTYSISEGMSFNTAYGTIVGARSPDGYFLTNEADFISVVGDEVMLNISGVDFEVVVD
ncbi:hypothetical protein ACPW6J_001648 [Enterobacter hormaechei]